jgi:hypothetical protein
MVVAISAAAPSAISGKPIMSKPTAPRGEHTPDNYLAAHPICNNYRWDYLPEAFELILRIGVLARTEVGKGTKVGKEVAKKFLQKEKQRIRRRKSTSKSCLNCTWGFL